MGVLTKNEREALEDVFLSIHTSNRYEKLKEITELFFTKQKLLNLKKLLKQAKFGLKEAKKSHFLLKYAKKKKNLSK